MRTLIVISAALAGGVAYGQKASFDNHLQSTVMVSPAQIYQIDEMKTDFSLGYSSTGAESKPDEGDADKTTISGTGIFAAGIYNVKSIGLRAGLQLNYNTGSSDIKETVTDLNTNTTATVEYTNDVNTTVITPVAAYSVGPVVIGAALDVTQMTLKPEEGDNLTSTHNTFRPGVLYADGPIEAGIAYASPNNIKAKDDELPVFEAAVVALHGRYAIDKTMAAGAIITNENWSALEEDYMTDRQTVTGTFEMAAGEVKVEGDLGWKSKAWQKKNNAAPMFNADYISTINVGGAADYAVNKTTNIGGALNYEFGSETEEKTEISTNVLSVAVRGNMIF